MDKKHPDMCHHPEVHYSVLEETKDSLYSNSSSGAPQWEEAGAVAICRGKVWKEGEKRWWVPGLVPKACDSGSCIKAACKPEGSCWD